jgi:hypothetical protein
MFFFPLVALTGGHSQPVGVFTMPKVDVEATFARFFDSPARTPEYARRFNAMLAEEQVRERNRIVRRSVLAHSAIVREAVKLTRKAEALAARLRTFAQFDETDVAEVLTDAGLAAEVLDADDIAEPFTAEEFEFYFHRVRTHGVALAELLAEVLADHPINDFAEAANNIPAPVFLEAVPRPADAA